MAVKKLNMKAKRKRVHLTGTRCRPHCHPQGDVAKQALGPPSPSGETRSAGEQELAAGMDFGLLLAKPEKYHSPAGLYD